MFLLGFGEGFFSDAFSLLSSYIRSFMSGSSLE